MRNHRNNHKRNRFRNSGDRNFKRNGVHQKISSDFTTNGSDFRRKNPGKNNQNAHKLVERYNDLAREALSNGDKILSENYLQHADHFARISEKQIIEKTNKSNESLEGLDSTKKESTQELGQKNILE